MVITSLENNKVKEIVRLKNKKYRDLEDLFIVEGEHLVLEAINANLLKEVVIVDGFDMDVSVNKVFVTNEVMKKISDLDNAPNIIGIVYKKKEEELGNRILILDDIQDPGNLGTIIRSGMAFNIDTIVLSNNSVDLYNPKVIRSTQGMLFHINIIRRDLDNFVDIIKDSNIPLYVTQVEDGDDIRNLKNNEKNCFALVMGNEGNGVRNSIVSKADRYIYININNKVESLNVGVATSILLYELGR